MTVCDAAFGEIVRRHFQRHAVARQNTDAVAPELAGQVREHLTFLIQLDAEQAARKFFNYCTSDFDVIFFGQKDSSQKRL